MKKYIIGAIAGDIIGSVYEWHNVKTIDFPLFTDEMDFTDDSVLTLATMNALNETKELNKRRMFFNKITVPDYAGNYFDFGKKYPGRGYGGS